MDILVEFTLNTAKQFLGRRTLHLTSTKSTRNLPAALTIGWVGRTYSQTISVLTTRDTTAFLYLSAIFFFKVGYLMKNIIR